MSYEANELVARRVDPGSLPLHRSSMTGPLSARITRNPLAFETSRGDDVLTGLPGQSGALKELLHGTASSSPYLAGLMRREATWLEDVLTQAPETAFQALLDGLSDAPSAKHTMILRQAKRRAALLIALCDLGGVWTGAETTQALTQLADRALDIGLTGLVDAEISRGKLPGQGANDVISAGGMVIVAMGKMGAFELNYSSDIDLICLFDQDRYDKRDVMTARAAFISLTRRLMALMSDMTGDGYVFRTDLRLRPDPSVTPVCIAMDAAERYYESIGRGWERAAHIKARAAVGDIASGEAYLDRLTPFVWRKHLDFVALRESEEMRQRIRAHKGLLGEMQVEGHNIKLGVGGIREIEFFTQTHQMISGGRDPSLRTRRTDEGLRALANAGWVPRGDAEALAHLYWQHRRIEHGTQMIQDAQTHTLPSDVDGIKRLSYLLGEGDVDRFRIDLLDRLRETVSLTERFFAPPENSPRTRPEPELSNYSKDIIAAWRRYPALRSQKAVEIFERLKPEILSKLNRASNPEEALLQFDGFLSGLPAGVQLFTLFEARPQLIDLIVDICATAPALARYLSRNSAVFDAVIGGDFFADWPGAEVLAKQLHSVLDHAGQGVGDYERQLDAARRWRKEWHFRIGVHHLRGLITGAEAARQYSELADAVVQAILPCVVADFASRHGLPPGRGAAVVGLGSLGAQRLAATSDLDLIMIYDANGVETSDGPRPLASVMYYARLTKALVTALSAPMSEGIAYEVDMRLRPSGRQGPVATALPGFESYQRHDAWTWEHLALTRARVLACTTDPSLGDDIAAIRRDVLEGPKDRPKILQDVVDMRTRLFAAKPGDGVWDAKAGPGKITDIELLAQVGALLAGDASQDPFAQLHAAKVSGLIDERARAHLASCLDMLDALNQASRLLGERGLDIDKTGQGGLELLYQVLNGADRVALETSIAESSASSAKIIAEAYQSKLD